jgi:hypothetical protein
MHYGGLEGNRPTIEALQALAQVGSEQRPFKDQGISLGGFILTGTRLEENRDAGGRDWATVERDHNALRQEGGYVAKLLGGVL